MITFNYSSKKSGQSYLYTTATVFAAPQDVYAWKRGVREYADNYTADHTLKNRSGERMWPGTDAEYAAKAHELNVEAHTRFAAGNVPSIGDMAPFDPELAMALKMGITVDRLRAILAAGAATEAAESVETPAPRQRRTA